MSKRRPSGRVTMTPVDWMDLVAKSFSDLRTTIQSRNANDGAGFSASYAAIKEVNYMAPATVSQLPDNKDKNRYKNVLAYDATRVVLQPAKKKGPDYVNANWIPGKDGSQDYIASQGPVPASFGDFWSMVLQTGVETIVMTTREVEGGKLKCHRYWPDPTSKPMKKQLKFNDCKVTFQSSEYHEGHTIRQFLLEGKRNGKKAKREVTQICYESWPDHGVPLSSDEFLSFREKVVQLQEQQSDPKLPLLVHCSAGVGRTGTYIAIDT